MFLSANNRNDTQDEYFRPINWRKWQKSFASVFFVPSEMGSWEKSICAYDMHETQIIVYLLLTHAHTHTLAVYMKTKTTTMSNIYTPYTHLLTTKLNKLHISPDLCENVPFESNFILLLRVDINIRIENLFFVKGRPMNIIRASKDARTRKGYKRLYVTRIVFSTFHFIPSVRKRKSMEALHTYGLSVVRVWVRHNDLLCNSFARIYLYL